MKKSIVMPLEAHRSIMLVISSSKMEHFEMRNEKPCVSKAVVIGTEKGYSNMKGHSSVVIWGKKNFDITGGNIFKKLIP